jgi:membrane protein DedA with SNARE-associated domain
MALETVVFPIPSEIVMPLAGWKLIEEKDLGWWWVILAGLFGAIGSTLGAIGIYYAARWGGRPLLYKYGKYVLISRDDIDMADRFFDRYGPWTIFFGRMVPLVRSLVSVPAGIVEMPIWKFTIYTFLGSFIWAVGLAYGGYRLGREYEDIRAWMAPADYPVMVIIVLAVGWYIYRSVKKVWWDERKEGATPAEPKA